MSNLPIRPPGSGKQLTSGSARKAVRQLQRTTGFIDRLAGRLLPYDAQDTAAPDQRARPTILIGLMVMLVLFGGIGLWAAVVPLAAGAIAPGRVVAESNRKEIQHLEGGIIKEILVKEGEVVSAGQILVRLDSTNAQSRNEQVLGQYLAAKATEGRLIAERDDKPEISFAPELLQYEATYPKVKEALDTQRNLFNTRRKALNEQIGILNQKVAQSEDEIRGLREQINAANEQISLLNKEIGVVDGLLKTGNALQSRLLGLQRQSADMIGRRGQAQAMISRANQTISESKISIINQRTEFQKNVGQELKETQVQLSTLQEQARTSGDAVRRVEVKAPISGTVTALSVHTIDGVVQPGETLLTIVPNDDKLVIEAHVNPQDIDVVHAGLVAQVRLTAFKMRYLRPVKGTVKTISADRFDDAKTGESYFLARIEIPQSELNDLGNIKLTPGMPADTLIVTGSRTMLSYIVEPIRDSFGHAFHDQ